MQDSMKNYFRLSIVFSMAYPVGQDNEKILECVRKIALDPDFEAVELTHIEDDETRKKAIKMCRTANLDVSYAAQSCVLMAGVNPNATDEAERQKAVQLLKDCIDEAYEMGAESLGFVTGHYDPNGVEKALDCLDATVSELCEHAAKKGDMIIGVEVFDYDLDKCALIGPADRARAFGERMSKKYDNFCLITDLSHIPQIHESIQESVVPVLPYLKQMHMGNCVIQEGCANYGDKHPRFYFPNSEVGVEELTEYLRLLLDKGIINRAKRPILSFEIKPFEDEDPDLVIANAKRVLDLAWLHV